MGISSEQKLLTSDFIVSGCTKGHWWNCCRTQQYLRWSYQQSGPWPVHVFIRLAICEMIPPIPAHWSSKSSNRSSSHLSKPRSLSNYKFIKPSDSFPVLLLWLAYITAMAGIRDHSHSCRRDCLQTKAPDTPWRKFSPVVSSTRPPFLKMACRGSLERSHSRFSWPTQQWVPWSFIASYSGARISGGHIKARERVDMMIDTIRTWQRIIKRLRGGGISSSLLAALFSVSLWLWKRTSPCQFGHMLSHCC